MMHEYTTIKEAAERYNIPIETLVSWIEQNSTQQKQNFSRDEFIKQMQTGEFQELISYYNGR